MTTKSRWDALRTYEVADCGGDSKEMVRAITQSAYVRIKDHHIAKGLKAMTDDQSTETNDAPQRSMEWMIINVTEKIRDQLSVGVNVL